MLIDRTFFRARSRAHASMRSVALARVNKLARVASALV